MEPIRTLGPGDLEHIPASLAEDRFFWLDLLDPDDAVLAQVGHLLGWHPLLVEDLQHGGQRPKVEDFADHSLVVTYAAVVEPLTGRIAVLEHALVVHGGYLVTVHHHGIGGLGGLVNHVSDEAGLSEAGLVHRVLDLIIDTTMLATDTIVENVDRIEQSIEEHPDAELLADLRSRRRDLVSLRSTAVAQRDALMSLSVALEQIPGFEVGMRSHYRDVTDHASRVVDQLQVARELLDASFDAYYTMLITNQGRVAQRLTVVATIFLPLTFLTGFFGQNFGWMVRAIDSRADFVVFGLGSSALLSLGLVVVFRRLRWF